MERLCKGLDLRCLFNHANDRQMLTDTYNGWRHGKPAVHKNVGGVDTRIKSTFDHIHKVSRALHRGFFASLVSARAFIHDLGGITESLGGTGSMTAGQNPMAGN